MRVLKPPTLILIQNFSARNYVARKTALFSLVAKAFQPLRYKTELSDWQALAMIGTNSHAAEVPAIALQPLPFGPAATIAKSTPGNTPPCRKPNLVGQTNNLLRASYCGRSHLPAALILYPPKLLLPDARCRAPDRFFGLKHRLLLTGRLFVFGNNLKQELLHFSDLRDVRLCELPRAVRGHEGFLPSDHPSQPPCP